MADLRATVLIPTHEHGDLLRLSAASALEQTLQDLEVFIVLDGPDPETMAAAEDVAGQDNRVRLFPNDKGERHGEAHRHAALREARGRIVCYLSDDDLWSPDHVEYLDGLLARADFAHSVAVVAQVGGEPRPRFVGDLGDRWFLDRMRSGKNFIPLSAAGHTLTAYRALPVGWSPAPATQPTDLHMWLKFLAVPDIRLVSGVRSTVLHVPSSDRPSMTPEDRLAELESWHALLREAGGWDELRSRVHDALPARAAAAFKEGYEARARLEGERADIAEEQKAHLEKSLAAAREREARAEERCVELEGSLAAAVAREQDVETALAASEQRVVGLEGKLTAIRGSVAYRASRRLAAIPVVGRLSRWVGVALARRGGR